jgi:putative PIN family toxin of toxin-antitoxin system
VAVQSQTRLRERSSTEARLRAKEDRPAISSLSFRTGELDSLFVHPGGIAYNTGMRPHQIVIDTNVLVSALRSRRGASYLLMSLVDSGKFVINLSVPLVLEYEAVAKRMITGTPLTIREVDDILDYIVRCSEHWKIFYLWRPGLKDPGDDMLLELAVTAGCRYIITFNVGDFAGAKRFGIQAITPQEFLKEIGELP